jgi:2-keto-4-pentenoate hydratase
VDLAVLADRLLAARATGEPIELLSADAVLSEELAYELQDLVVAGVCRGGADAPAGYKIAMTSPETMALAGASQPAYGVVLRSALLASPAQVPLTDLYQGRVEGELIFLVDRDLPPGAGPEDILGGCRVVPGLELPSTRYRDWFGRVQVPDLVADNTATGRVVVGADAVPAASLRLGAVEMVLRLDGDEIAHGVSTAVLGDPVNALVWLVRRLAGRGRHLRAGEIVSSGTFHMPPPIRPGRYEARFEGLGTARATIS